MLTFVDNLPSGGDTMLTYRAPSPSISRSPATMGRHVNCSGRLAAALERGRQMTRQWVGVFLVLALPGIAAADDDYRHARIRYVEDGVSIQRPRSPAPRKPSPTSPSCRVTGSGP